MVGYGATLPPCWLLAVGWIMQVCITRHRAKEVELQTRAENGFRSRRRSRSAGFRLSGAAMCGVLHSSF